MASVPRPKRRGALACMQLRAHQTPPAGQGTPGSTTMGMHLVTPLRFKVLAPKNTHSEHTNTNSSRTCTPCPNWLSSSTTSGMHFVAPDAKKDRHSGLEDATMSS
eukprot:1161553-Pelagomonas_calceolata.AAC.6